MATETLKRERAEHMRQVFCDETTHETRKAVQDDYPWAVKIVKVNGGWMVFETLVDYATWRNQK